MTLTRKPWLGSLLDCPGANFCTMTSLDIHLGLEHFSTTGVPRMKFLMTRELYVLPSQFIALGARHLFLSSFIFGQQFIRVWMVNEFREDFGWAIFRGKDRVFSYVACELIIYILFQFFTNIKPNLHCLFGELADSDAIFNRKLVTIGSGYSVFPKTLNNILKLYFSHEDDVFMLIIKSGVSINIARS